MAQFITRVELHKVAHDHVLYGVLHAAMARRYFQRTMRSKAGVLYDLPPATYYSFGDLKTEDVLDLAQRAASETGHPFSIVVTESNDTWFSGLQPTAFLLPALSSATRR